MICLAMFLCSASQCSKPAAEKVDSSSSTAAKKSKTNKTAMAKKTAKKTERLNASERAYFASGCFWCVEAVFESVRGVEESVSGYSGGTEENPTYRQVGGGKSSHAEAVEIYYDPEIVSYESLVRVFFGSQDPTTPNRQGPDRGSQYRSIAFYQNTAEKATIEKVMAELTEQKVYANPIVTEVVPFEKFWVAEDYHQDYERINPGNPYVQSVSIPRLKRFQAKFPELLKKKH